MQSNHFSKAIVLTLVIVISFVTYWEWYWRNKGYTISYNDDKFMWAEKRKEIYMPINKSTVFIGDSRIKFDLDIPTWERLTGEEAVQLAFVGTTPRPVLHNLAEDKNFRGKAIIDVSERLFFSVDSIQRERPAREAIEYYYKETPAQNASTIIDHALESKLVFLEEGKFGLDELLRNIKLPDRKGFKSSPILPKEFYISSEKRQSLMTPMFLADESLQDKKLQTWTTGAQSGKTIPITGETLEAYLKEIKIYVDKIRSRGGIVVFVRPPSDGMLLETENRDYPRKQYWDRLIEYTKAPGYYYSDYAATAHLMCVEESHLSPHDAAIYTAQLINILRTQAGWIFPQSSTYNFKP